MDVRPFDVKLWDYQATIQGSGGFWRLLKLPINSLYQLVSLGAQANANLGLLFQERRDENSMIPWHKILTGNYNSSEIALLEKLSIGDSIEQCAQARDIRRNGKRYNQKAYRAVQILHRISIKARAQT